MLISKHKHYRSFEVQKKSGGMRQIDAPRTYLKVVQWWILSTILESVEASPHAFGFVKNRSYVDNARFHLGAAHVLNVDIEDFFPSIKTHHVEKIFRSFGYRESIAAALSHLTTYAGVLPQGAPTSPSLANIYMTPLDSAINEIAAQRHLKFSRYADDITLSGHNKIDAGVINEIEEALAKYSLRLNPKKTKFMGANEQKEVTGLVLAETGVAFPQEFLNSARGWFHRVAKDPKRYRDDYDKIRGTLSTIRYVGGRGSPSVIRLGAAAVAAVEQSFFTNVVPFTVNVDLDK